MHRLGQQTSNASDLFSPGINLRKQATQTKQTKKKISPQTQTISPFQANKQPNFLPFLLPFRFSL